MNQTKLNEICIDNGHNDVNWKTAVIREIRVRSRNSDFFWTNLRDVWAQEQLRVYVQHEARQHKMEQTQCMDVVLCCSLSHGSILGGHPRRPVITSLVSMRSVCAVSRSVIRFVLRVLRSPERTHHNQRVVCLRLCRQRVEHQPKRNLALNSVLAQQTFVAKVTVCRREVSQQTFVSGLDHCCALIMQRGIRQTSSMFFQHPSSRHRHSVVSRWRHCLSSVIVCFFRPSHVHLLHGASISRPHHCQQQWFASKQSVGGRVRNHNAAPHCCKESDRSNSLWLCRLVLLPCYSVQYSTVRISSRLLSSAASAISFHCLRPWLGLTSSAFYVHELVVFPLYASHTCTSPNSIHWHVFNLSHSIDVWHSPPGGTYTFDRITINLQDWTRS